MVGISTGNGHGFLQDLTIALVGCKGSGKSATGNSILGRKAFQSISSFGPVTTVSMRQAAVLENGRVLNVIDTPGLFDSAGKPQLVQKEILKCIEMAKDGLHAILMVVSLKVRFSDEQVTAVEALKQLFGSKVVDYMIIVFTGADELGEDESLDDYLTHACPPPLKDLLEQCGNRRVAFDNKTKDASKKANQLNQLLTLIGNTVLKNGGKPYTHELFVQLKKEAAEKDSDNSKQNKHKQNDEEHKQPSVGKKVDEKVMGRDENIINKAKERDEAIMNKAKGRDEEIINKLKQDLEAVQKETDEQIEEQEEARYEIKKLREQLERAQKAAEARRKWCPYL